MLNVPESTRPGMSATADIITDVKEDVVAIPIQCLTVRQEGWEEEAARKNKRGRNSQTQKSDNSDNEEVPVDEKKKKEMIEVVFVTSDKASVDDDEDDKSKSRGKPLKKGHKYAKIVPVKVGISSEDHYEILEGLNEGDEIITGSYKAISRDLKHMTEVETKGSEGKNKDKDEDE